MFLIRSCPMSKDSVNSIFRYESVSLDTCLSFDSVKISFDTNRYLSIRIGIFR